MEAHIHFRKFFECLPSLWLQKKKEGNNKRRMDGRERGRKERNIQKRNIFLYKYTEKERKEGRGKKKKKFYINLFFQGTRVSLYLLVFI